MARGSILPLAGLAGLYLLAVGRLTAQPTALTIPPGTDIPVTLDANVTVKPDQIGNIFPAHTTRDVMVHGAIAIPAGTPVDVALVKSQEGPSTAAFRLVRLSIQGEMRPVRTDVARADATGSGLSTRRKTGIGALAGGALGIVLGGGSGLLKGAVAGAGGGLAWGLLGHGSSRVEHDTRFLFALRSPVQIG